MGLMFGKSYDYKEILNVIQTLERVIELPQNLPEGKTVGDLSDLSTLLINYVNSIETPNQQHKRELESRRRYDPEKYKNEPEDLEFIPFDKYEIEFLKHRAHLNCSRGDFFKANEDILELLIERRVITKKGELKFEYNKETEEVDLIHTEDEFKIRNISNPFKKDAKKFYSFAINLNNHLSLDDKIKFHKPLINVLNKKVDKRHIPFLINLQKAVYLNPKNKTYLLSVSKIFGLFSQNGYRGFTDLNIPKEHLIFGHGTRYRSDEILNQAKKYVDELLKIDPNHKIGITDKFILDILSEGVKTSDSFFNQLDETLEKGVEQHKVLDFVLRYFNKKLPNSNNDFNREKIDGILVYKTKPPHEKDSLEKGVIKLSERYSKLFPDSVNPYITLSEVLFQRLDFDEALKINKEGIDIVQRTKGDQIPLYEQRIKILKFSNEYDEALEYCDKLISIQPQSTSAYNSKAIINFNLGKYEEALEDIDQCLSLKPSDDEPFLKLKAEILYYRLESAPTFDKEKYDEAMKFDKENQFAYRSLEFLRARILESQYNLKEGSLE